VESYGGLVFASWDPQIVPLAEYLGDLRWYLDRLLVQEHLGGLEVVGGRQRYLMPTNWKLLADNFHGDNYHVPTTHASFFKVTAQDASSYRGQATFGDRFQAAAGYGTGVSHGLGALEVGERPHLYERDLKVAEDLGPEAVAWVHERYRRIEERLRNDRAKVRGFSNCNIFPSLSFISFPSAFRAVGLIQWHPRGPMLCEAWQWGMVERDAPQAVKEEAIRNLMLGQAAAGMLAPDDTENFERSTDNLLSRPGPDHPFHYAMGLGHEGDPGLSERLREQGIDAAHLPGRIGPYNGEANQRDFYRYWAELMTRQPPAGAVNGA
jgi:dibenzofuran dioxygenase alpha subunit